MRNRHDPFGKRRLLALPVILIIAAAAVAAVMGLWNAILPELTGVKQISYWQSLGLLVLCRILFAPWGNHRHDRHHHGKFRGQHPHRAKAQRMLREKMMRMNEDERRVFVEEWKKRFRP